MYKNNLFLYCKIETPFKCTDAVSLIVVAMVALFGKSVRSVSGQNSFSLALLGFFFFWNRVLIALKNDVLIVQSMLLLLFKYGDQKIN